MEFKSLVVLVLRILAATMVCFSDIKFHGYFIGTLAGLLEMASLGLSLYSHCVGGKGGGENGLAGDRKDYLRWFQVLWVFG